MTIEEWLQPVSSDSPCGPNLEYDADFLKLEEAARATPDQEFGRDGGEAIRIQGANADWREVQRLAEGLLARSKDLRVAVYLCRALLHNEGFAGGVTGLALVEGLLETFWDGLHPELDADDNDDPTMRLNALVPLGALEAVVGDLRASFVLRSRSRGELRVRDIEIAQGRLPAASEGAALTEAQLAGLLAAAIDENPGLPKCAADGLACVRRIVGILGERVGEAFVPDLKLLQAALYSVSKALGGAAPEAAGEASGEPGAEPADAPPGGPGRVAAVAVPGEIRSREDVMQTLGRLCDYLSRHEPTNPVQLVLRRAQRMMNMSFLELMQDLAPDGLTQAETVVGEKLHKDEEE